MKIEQFPVTKLVNEMHLQMMNQVDSLLNTIGIDAGRLNVDNEYQIFKQSLTTEQESYHNDTKSSLTNQIELSDKFREKLFSGFYKIIEGNVNHFDTNTSASAQRLLYIINQFGNPINFSYNEETLKINGIIEEFGKIPADITNLGLTEWVAAIKQANTDFENIHSNRTNEYSEQTAPCMKTARVVTDLGYKSIVERINALALINGISVYAPFMSKMNEIITEYREILAKKEGKAKAAVKPTNQQTPPTTTITK
jgi:hypothetical protein